jgi:bifunctional non-homologous end joining protein LigD
LKERAWKKIVDCLYEELESAKIRLKPKVYLSDEWGCPEGPPIIGIPFYLADEKLSRIEHEIMEDIEAESDEDILRYLRHVTGFCKTTGGKGLHVVTALTSDKKSPDWWAAKTFAQEVCRRLAADQPDHFSMTMAKKDRGGRIFLDYLRNDRMATAVAPLSPRARKGATVSMPVDWSQVHAGLDPKKFTVRMAPSLLRKNRPWKDYTKSAKPLRQAIEKLLKTR